METKKQELPKNWTLENLEDDRLVLNMGPSHPAMHGIVRVLLTVQGERITDSDVEIGPLTVIGEDVQIGAGTKIGPHCIFEFCTVGKNNLFTGAAYVGMPPQDWSYKGEHTRFTMGDNNVIRESVTMNRGTAHGHMESKVGSGCLFMAYSHVAHDCTVGDNVILANSVGLAGHVTLGDNVILAGLAAVHQFCEIGPRAFVGGGAMVAQNVPPYCIAVGDRAQLAGLNVIGLRRAGWSREKLHLVRRAFGQLFLTAEPREKALERTEAELAPQAPEIAELCAFIRRAGRRGVCSARRGSRVPDLTVAD